MYLNFILKYLLYIDYGKVSTIIVDIISFKLEHPFFYYCPFCLLIYHIHLPYSTRRQYFSFPVFHKDTSVTHNVNVRNINKLLFNDYHLYIPCNVLRNLPLLFRDLTLNISGLVRQSLDSLYTIP